MCLHAPVWMLPRYGGLFNIVDEMKAELQGIGGADSVVVDPHKTLFTSCALHARRWRSEGGERVGGDVTGI